MKVRIVAGNPSRPEKQPASERVALLEKTDKFAPVVDNGMQVMNTRLSMRQARC